MPGVQRSTVCWLCLAQRTVYRRCCGRYWLEHDELCVLCCSLDVLIAVLPGVACTAVAAVFWSMAHPVALTFFSLTPHSKHRRLLFRTAVSAPAVCFCLMAWVAAQLYSPPLASLYWIKPRTTKREFSNNFSSWRYHQFLTSWIVSRVYFNGGQLNITGNTINQQRYPVSGVNTFVEEDATVRILPCTARRVLDNPDGIVTELCQAIVLYVSTHMDDEKINPETRFFV